MGLLFLTKIDLSPYSTKCLSKLDDGHVGKTYLADCMTIVARFSSSVDAGSACSGRCSYRTSPLKYKVVILK